MSLYPVILKVQEDRKTVTWGDCTDSTVQQQAPWCPATAVPGVPTCTLVNLESQTRRRSHRVNSSLLEYSTLCVPTWPEERSSNKRVAVPALGAGAYGKEDTGHPPLYHTVHFCRAEPPLELQKQPWYAPPASPSMPSWIRHSPQPNSSQVLGLARGGG